MYKAISKTLVLTNIIIKNHIRLFTAFIAKKALVYIYTPLVYNLSHRTAILRNI